MTCTLTSKATRWFETVLPDGLLAMGPLCWERGATAEAWPNKTVAEVAQGYTDILTFKLEFDQCKRVLRKEALVSFRQ